MAQEYPDGLCDAFLEGILEEKANRSMGIGAVGEVEETEGGGFEGEYEEDGEWQECWD